MCRIFLAAGKAVVILNGTEHHLADGLSRSVWAHTEVLPAVAPAIAFVEPPGPNGKARNLVQVDFPVDIAASPDSGPLPPPPLGGSAAQSPLTLLRPTPEQLAVDSQQWLGTLERTLAASVSDIDPATGGPGQMVLSYEEVEPLVIEQGSVLNGQPAPYGTAWGPSGTRPPNFGTKISATFYTRLYAMLLGNSPADFQHQVIARQYLLVSPPSPLATVLVTNQYAIFGSN